MLIDFKNSRGQIIGFYDTDDFTYRTERRVEKGEIFLRKTEFNSRIKLSAIAIDVSIVRQLAERGCTKIIFTIYGLKESSFSVYISPEDVIKKGVMINYDKKADGEKYTGYGEQYVISPITDCIPLEQSKLIEVER